MIYELGTTWTKGRANGGLQIFFSTPKFRFHPRDNGTQDILDVAPPATMYVRHQAFYGIKKEHGLTVRLLDHKGHMRQGRHHSIRMAWFLKFLNLLFS